MHRTLANKGVDISLIGFERNIHASSSIFNCDVAKIGAPSMNKDSSKGLTTLNIMRE